MIIPGIIKSHIIKQKLTDSIFTELGNYKLRLVGHIHYTLTKEDICMVYPHHLSSKFWDEALRCLTNGNSVLFIMEGNLYFKDLSQIKLNIRCSFSKNLINNAIHLPRTREESATIFNIIYSALLQYKSFLEKNSLIYCM